MRSSYWYLSQDGVGVSVSFGASGYCVYVVRYSDMRIARSDVSSQATKE